MTTLRELVWPSLCPDCLRGPSSSTAALCATCDRLLRRVPPPHCFACGGTIDGVLAVCSECVGVKRPWHRAVSAFEFGGEARHLIHRFKYQGDVALTPALAKEAWAAWQLAEGPAVDVIVPVPLHWFREARRGYNQAELLAQAIGKLSALPVESLLRRAKWTKPQASLNMANRRRNLRRAFALARQGSVKGRRVLLVDDVFTTGATLAVCTELLNQAGAAQVDVLTLARG